MHASREAHQTLAKKQQATKTSKILVFALSNNTHPFFFNFHLAFLFQSVQLLHKDLLTEPQLASGKK
jgi:hypothetical protein